MAEFVVNEAGCRNLADNMRTQLAAIQARVSEIESHEGMLRSALGPDYEAIARSTRAMTAELEEAQRSMNTVIANMTEYIARVGEIRVTLNG